MSITSKVRLVERLFDRLEQEIAQFKVHTNLHCISGCGKCCSKPDIDASPLEFLPWAFHIFLNGEAKKVYDQLNESTATICHVYRPLSLLDSHSGSCSSYQYRGLICRLFGYAATKDKYGLLRLATCSIIKKDQPNSFENAQSGINAGLKIPIFSDYYMNLSQIDIRLGNTIVPINKAMKMALEEVLSYYAYRPFPSKLKRIA